MSRAFANCVTMSDNIFSSTILILLTIIILRYLKERNQTQLLMLIPDKYSKTYMNNATANIIVGSIYQRCANEIEFLQ